MDNSSGSWKPTTAYEPLIEPFIFTIPATPSITTTPPSAAVAAAKPTYPTTAVMATISHHAPSPSLHPLEQLPMSDTHAQTPPSPSFPMSSLPANDNSSSSTSTTCSLPPSTPLQTTTENATLPPVNISNSSTTTTTSLDTSGTPASNTPFTTNNNSNTLNTNNNTNMASKTVTDNDAEPKTANNSTTNNNSSSNSSNTSRHASSPSSSTTASDKSIKNASPAVRKISTMTSGGKTLGFLGSLSPKSSRYKISNKKTTAQSESSSPPSPAPPSPYSNNTPPTTSHSTPPTLPPSHAPASLTLAKPEEVTTPTSQYLQLPVSSNISSPSGKMSMDHPDSPQPSQQVHQQQLQHSLQQDSPESSKDKAEKKRSKDKDRHHSHFGQRISKAIGLSSSSSKNQHQQRLRQLSVDSLSTIDAVPHSILGTTTTSDDSPQQRPQQPQHAQQHSEKSTPEKEKEKKGGIMNHFLHRPRILGLNDGAKSKGSTQNSAGGATGVGGSMAALVEVNAYNTPYKSFARSATNSDISLDSESHRQDGAYGSGFAVVGEDSDMAALRKFQSRHRQDRGSSSSGKSLIDTLTAHNFRRRPSLIVDLMPLPSSQQRQQRHQCQPLPPSLADMVESSQELHPHHQPEDMERLNLYTHLGLQEIHYATGTGEEPSEQMIRQLYGHTSAPRKSHSSTLLLPRQTGYSSSDNIGVLEPHGRRRSSPGANLSGWNTSVLLNTSPLGPITASPVAPSKVTSSRLGKLGRFKFPSLSLSNIHRHKQGSLNGSTSSIQSTSDDQHHATILANFNDKRRSSLSIPFKSSMFDSVVTAVPPPSPVSHIHVSDSTSTFASVNTVGMTTMGPSTVGSSSNHSSISSSYHVHDTAAAASGSMGDSKKPRQSLAAFLEEQTHHPHHSSTNGKNGLPSTALVVSPARHQQQLQLQTLQPVLSNQDIAAGVPLQQQQPHQHHQQHYGHQRQKSRSLGKSFAGSEKFSASTASVTGTSNGSIASGSSGSSSQHHHGMSLGFRSGFLRRSSRRTVSASHISSKNIFASELTAASRHDAATLAYQDLMDSQVQTGPGEGNSSNGVEVKLMIRQSESDRGIPSTAMLQDVATDTQDAHGGKHGDDGGSGAGDSGTDSISSIKSTGPVVGQYLFGDELKNLSFGDRDSALVKVDSAVDTTGAVLFEAESGLKTVSANTVAEDALVVTQVTIPSTPTSPLANAAKTTTDSDKALLSKLLSGKKKSDSFLPTAKDSTLPTHILPTSATSPKGASSSPTHLYTTDSKPAQGPALIPKDKKLTLSTKTIPSSKQQEIPSTLTPPTFIPRSPAAVAASRKFPGSPGYGSSPPPSYSTHPPILGPHIPAPGTTTTSKSKFSILGASSTPNSGFSYLQSRPSLCLTMSSSAAPSKSEGVGPTSISTSSPYMPYHSSSTPLPGKSSSGFGSSGSPTPHLEPRSAVVDYRPAIHYKRQRSMSLQDADLLTADQFIALMPDDAPTKRRFSSEETLQDNNWATSVKAKNVPLPDPPTTLRSLHCTLKTKCDLVLKHLAAVSAPVPSGFPTSPQQQYQQSQDQTQQQASAAARHMASATTSASFVPSATFSSSNLTLSTLSRSGSESLSTSTTELARTLAKEKEVSLAVSPSEQILIRIQGAESGQTSLPFKDEGTGSRRVSVDDTHSKRRGSGQSFVNSATPGGVRPKKGSLVVGGGSLGSSSVGQEAEAIPTGRSSESCQESLVPIDVDQMDVVETVGMLFDEMDQIMTRMAEMFAKYISTDHFSNLLKESDEICFQAQEVCRVELDRRCSQRHQQFHQQQQHQHQQVPERDVEVVDIEFDYECKTTVEPQVSSAQNHFEPHTQRPGFNNESKTFVDPNDRQQTQSTPLSAQRNPSEQPSSTITTTTDSVFASVVGPETVGDYDDRQVKKKDSKDRISHLRNRNHYKHQYRYQPQGQKPGDTDVNGEMSSEEHQGAVYDYIRTVLATAEVTMAEYMRMYNRMLVVPTNGYRIEGCNDLKKIERSLRPEHPHMPPISIAIPNAGSSQPSLMSRVSVVQNASADATAPSDGSKPQTSAAILSADYNPSTSSGSPLAFASSTTTADTNQTPSSPATNIFSPSSNATQGGETMVRVKSLPESKDEWAALQKRKEMGGSPGVAGAISMGTPAAVGIGVGTPGAGIGGGIGGIGTTGAAAGLATGNGIAMMGDYSKEHMGHEAYYYRNWFLGKEHRTFVGQVEGLGTVIISIIKDIVVPTETRPQIPSRSSTGPNSLSHQSSFPVPASAGAAGSGSTTHPATYVRPELVHSAQSFYPGRGGSYHGNGVGGGGMMTSPRTSLDAMRVVLSASTAVIPGPGSHDSHGSGLSGIGVPHSGPGSVTGYMASPHLAASTPVTPGPHSPSSLQSSHHTGSNNNANAPPRWQYRCILRQKDVDSLRITLPEPEPSPLNNLTRRAGKPQWKTILQSIHPAITQQVASKLKKIQNNQHFEMELAKFDETMLRFNYKFGVLLVHSGQTKEEDWFSNQMSSSPRFQEFLESGALGQKVPLKGFERFSAGLDTRSESAEYSYYDTWGEGFEIMYHVSTLLPYNTVDRQQIQRKRHIGNDIVCIIFVDGDQPFVPNAIKSQFLHIFVIIRLVTLSDGTRGYSATITCDEQVPEFGPPLPDPPIFRTPAELRAFLLCKMINGENAAYKAPRLIKPHQRARSGMLENLVAKANTLAKVKDIDKKISKQQKAPPVSTSTLTSAVSPTAPSALPSGSSSQSTLLSRSSITSLTPSHSTTSGASYNQVQNHCHACHCSQCHHRSSYQHGCHHCPYDGPPCCPAAPSASTSASSLGEEHAPPHHQSAHLINGRKGPIPAAIRTNSARNSLVVMGSETAATLFKSRRRNSNADSTKLEAQFYASNMSSKEKEMAGSGEHPQRQQRQQQSPEQFSEGHGYIENLLSPTAPNMMTLPSPDLEPASLSVADIGPFFQQGEADHCSGSCCQSSCCYCCTSCCGCTCCDESDHALETFQARPQPDKSSSAMKSGISYHFHQQLNLQNAMKQSSKSATASPTESQFAMNLPGNSSQAEYHSHYHTVTLMNGLDVAMVNAKKKESNTLGMSLTANNKGRSKSEVDLLVTPIHETHNSSPNRHSTGLILGTATVNYPMSGSSGLNEFHHHHHSHAGIIATTPHPHHHHHYNHRGHQHSLLAAGGAIPFRPSTTTTATTGPVIHQTTTAPAHSSMKGRAHNFLTTLVRRRASSNDTSGLGPTVHQITAPKNSHLSVMASSSPLGTWINTAGGQHHHSHRAHADQNLQHQQHCYHKHCCHRYQHHSSLQRHSLTSLSTNTACTASVPMAQESSAAIPIIGRPLKFKEGFNKSKTPIHINTAAAAALGSSHPNQCYQQSSHRNYNHNPPPSASTISSTSSSSLFHSSLPSASTLHTAGSTTFRSGSWGPATGAAAAAGANSGSSTNMMLTTPSSSSSTGFSPHSLRSFASREAIHRSMFSPPQNQWDQKQGFGRSTSVGSEVLTPTPVLAIAGGTDSDDVTQTKAEGKSSSDPAQVNDTVDGQQDGFQFTESPLPYTPQGQIPPASGSKVMESRTSSDSLGGQPGSSNTTTTTTTVPTAFPPGIGNLNKTSMDYMSFKPVTSSMSSSSARNSLLEQQRYDPGLSSAAARARQQSGDVRRGRRADADPDDDDDIEDRRNSSENLARFLSMSPLALRESHSVMAMDCPADHHCHQQQHHFYHHQHHQHLHHHHGHHSSHTGYHNHHHHHHHHHHHYHHTRQQQQQQYTRDERRSSSGSLPVRNESSSIFNHAGRATAVAHHPLPSKTAISFGRTDVRPSLSRTSTSSSMKQVKRAVSVESFLGQESVLSRVPSLRSKGLGLEAALISTMVTPPGLTESHAHACTNLPLAPVCCGGGSIAHTTTGADTACVVMSSNQDKYSVPETPSSATDAAADNAVHVADPTPGLPAPAKATDAVPVVSPIARTRQDLTFILKSSESQHSCTHEVEDLDVKPIDS